MNLPWKTWKRNIKSVLGSAQKNGLYCFEYHRRHRRDRRADRTKFLTNSASLAGVNLYRASIKRKDLIMKKRFLILLLSSVLLLNGRGWW